MKIFFFRHRKKNILAGVFTLMLFTAKSQSLLFPGDYLFDVQRQRDALTDTNVIVHTDLQPFIYRGTAADTFKNWKPGIDGLSDKLFYDNLIEVRHIDRSSGYDRKFNLNINPILNVTQGYDSYDSTHQLIGTNTRGFWINGQLGKKLIFESAFMENQFFMPAYLRAYALATTIVPGQGRWKNFKGNGFDYAMSCGILHFQASKNFSIRLGHGKQKTGYGYRSLLLSDNSFNYPYVQFTASFFKQRLQYSQTYALLMNLTAGGSVTPPGTERIFQKKAASFQQLSWHASKYLDVFAFQGMICTATDSHNVMHLDPLYANPVIFSNLGAFGFNNVNHILAGGGFQLRPLKKTCIYTQFMYDGTSDSSTTVYAFEAGIKLFDAFKLKNLFIQYEYNYVSKYAYQNHTPSQDYIHYNQSLTTPATFPQEHIAMISYSYKRFFVQFKQNYSAALTNDYQNVLYSDGKIGYVVNRSYNFNIAVGGTARVAIMGAHTKPEQMQLIYVSLRTSLYNLYYDF
jgi:hypothetical protein